MDSIPKNTDEMEKSLDLRKTGINGDFNERRSPIGYLSTLDLLIAAVLGVMGGFISGLIPFSLLVKTWYPFVGGTQLVSGHHLLWMAIAFGLTKKINVIPLTALIKGFINFLLGADWGAFEILISYYEAFFLSITLIIIFLMKEEDSYLGWAIAGGIGNLAQVPFFWLITGKIYILHWSLFVMACMFGFLSGVLITGILGLSITKKIRQSHVFD